MHPKDSYLSLIASPFAHQSPPTVEMKEVTLKAIAEELVGELQQDLTGCKYTSNVSFIEATILKIENRFVHSKLGRFLELTNVKTIATANMEASFEYVRDDCHERRRSQSIPYSKVFDGEAMCIDNEQNQMSSSEASELKTHTMFVTLLSL